MIIQSKKVWIADQFIGAQIEIDGGKIVNIYDYGEKPVDTDYGNERILPGFIDVHCHGAYGFDTNDAEEEGLRNWVANIVSEGVTALLPTTITQSEEVLTNALKNVAKVVREGYTGAEILGVHFEGPFLDMKYKGAQPEQYIVKPSVEQFKKYQEAADGLIRYITMATEQDDDFALTKYCAEHGVVVSIGHSAANSRQAVQAFAHGARSMTHVYNGMTPFNHRANGLVGAAYRIKSMYGEIICDGNHSTYAALHNFFEEKGPHYGMMVSDALMAKGSPAGSKFIFGGNEIEIYEDGSAHLTSSKGLAGSTLRINEGLRILIEEALVPVDTAINACTKNPAACLHIEDRKGAVKVGLDADLAVLDRDYNVLQTYCRGEAMLGRQ
ncbi:MAG TPA: N-acetylglucosamine-6-phosphate deacetylase [Candidatus Mediterraneibacter pullistercoris]|nr:N-acetylglucosamine-6-phosphate deacetylase [Candidatus Mediterraneibacter pullistercoris]